MNRRSALGTLVPLLTSVSGCTSGWPLGNLNNRPDDVAKTEFDVYVTGEEGFEDAPGVQDPPSVEFRDDETAIVVTGAFNVGSSDCNRASFEGVSSGSDPNEIEVRIGTERTSAGNDGAVDACPQDDHPNAYRLVVAFDHELPETVVVVEARGSREQKTVVER